MTVLKNAGDGIEAFVDKTHKLKTHSIALSEDAEAVENGDAYNINTGTIALTSTTASGIFYLKNDENRDLSIDLIAAGVGSAGTTTDSSVLTLITNPTSVSFSTNVDMNENRNIGSSKVLIGDAFKGAEGATVTGGSSMAQFFVAPGTRLPAPINITLTKGDSVAFTIDTNTTSGTTNVYLALVVHLKRVE